MLAHLKRCGLELKHTAVKTDNGTEYDGLALEPEHRTFGLTVEHFGARHASNPPSCPNADADVETLHARIEPEFYDRESFRGTADFLAKACTWQDYFNLARKNSYQNWRTPLQRLSEAAPELPERITLLAPVHLDTLLPRAKGRRPRSVSDALIDEAPAYIHHTPADPPGVQYQPGQPDSVPEPGAHDRSARWPPQPVTPAPGPARRPPRRPAPPDCARPSWPHTGSCRISRTGFPGLPPPCTGLPRNSR